MKKNKSIGNALVIVFILIIVLGGYFFFRLRFLSKERSAAVTVPPVSAEDHILGSKDARLVLIEYSDLECPYCKNFHQTMQQIMKEYGDKVAWVYRSYPLSFHQNAKKEAEAAECAAELGGNEAFWKYIDTIYERTSSNGTGFALAKLTPLAKEIGLNEDKFKQCLDSGKYAQYVQRVEAGGVKAGIQGTPGTIIIANNGKKDIIPGALPYDRVKAQLDALLK